MTVSALVLTATTRNPIEFELVLRPWELHFLPQSPGSFEHSITAIGSPLSAYLLGEILIAVKYPGAVTGWDAGVLFSTRLQSEPLSFG
ncbi:hypothetical protein [Bythopirellula polymerisocia]|uniref:Uncharacterized protein n=1 Tax=Bythopirellula polymerisocia TaxID=2528003 RepID=A0A5C6CUE9_9BACT|nr:hypothetical protein [Bythopirellula polymerisocia]TWU27485.1 hypothetical protein Pla144_22590 [Bythopirellula polymerisocia]